MSPRKLTEDDKQEILEQYRNSEATTSTLAKSFEVSSSTISRFLKNKLTTVEYEDLIQQKRLARTPRGEKSQKSAKKSAKKTKTRKKETATKGITDKPESKTRRKRTKKEIAEENAMPELATAEIRPQDTVESSTSETNKPETKTRRRRRSSSRATEITAETVETQEASETPETPPEVSQLELETDSVTSPSKTRRRRRSSSRAAEIAAATPEISEVSPEDSSLEPGLDSAKLVVDQPKSESEIEAIGKRDRLILKSDRLEEEDEDEDEMDLQALTEMLGEDLEDINDDEDDEDEDDWDEEDDSDYSAATSDLSDIQILPLSEASLPRTCYLVIDRSAELIVKPLAEFADLGAIPDTETSQKTLPVFDNHRIAKRFSHRRERVIKVPDGRMLQKTSHHLQDKGITRLLIDGHIYSLSQ
ncbi:MAG: hypothetical protein AAF652_00275 [Cyanobacteria bacterium P01_C01_bin.72]